MLNTPISFGDLIMLAGLMVIATNVVLKGQRQGIAPDDLFAGETIIEPDGLVPEAIESDIDLRETVVIIPPERIDN